MNINQVNNNLEEIAERYQSDSFLHRMKKMVRGIRQPKNTKEYKESLIEGQRLSAPLSAVLLPLLTILLLFLLTGSVPKEQTIPVVQWKPDDKPPVLVNPPPTKTEQPESRQNEMPDPGNFNPEPVIKEVEPPPVHNHQSPLTLTDFRAGPVIDWKPSGPGSGRADGVAKYEGTPAEDSVLKALRWLKKRQEPDGSWKQNKSAMTGLAILTFLAHNERPGRSEEFGDTVQKAIEFLMAGQERTSGLFAYQDGHYYSHPIATYAMCEAYAMTDNPSVKESAERALVPIIQGQHPTGGWTYRMDPGVDPATGKYRDDTSYMGWCAQALKAAQMAGIKVEGLDKAAKLAVKGFKKNAGDHGGFGYVSKSATHGLTSVGALCMEMLGAGDDSSVRGSLAVMESWQIGPYASANKVGESPQYYFYYATQSKFNFGGKSWQRWEREMQTSYIAAQRVEKNAIRDHKGIERDIGWWENGDKHSDRPVMDTCLTALQLMVYYRHLPTTMAKAFTVDPGVLATLRNDPGDIPVIVPGNL